jgi:hypothetical protein
MSQDTNVERNRDLLLERSIIGQEKYGCTTEREDLALGDWLQHAIEESLDLANYLQAAKETCLDCQPLQKVEVGQSKKESLVESVVNTGFGFGLALAAQEVLCWAYDLQLTTQENVIITLWMTVLSIGRNYFVRRVWNRRFWK